MKHFVTKFMNLNTKQYWNIFQIINFYIKDFKKELFLLVVSSIVVGLMETFQIILLYPILNASFNLQAGSTIFFEPFYNLIRNSLNLPDVVSFCLLFILLVFLTFIATLFYQYLSLKFTMEVITEKKGSVFDKLIENDFRYFVDNKKGDIIYSVVTAPERIKNYLISSTALVSDIVIIISIFLMLIFISLSGVALLLAGGLVFILIVRVIGVRIAYRLGKMNLISLQSENEVISNYVQGLRQIRSVDGDSYWKKLYNQALHNYWPQYIRYNLFNQLPGAMLQFIVFSTIAIVVILLYYVYSDGFIYIIPVVGIFAFSALKIIPRLTSISDKYMIMMDAWPNLEIIYHFLNDRRYNTIKKGNLQFDNLISDIIFDNVSFSYNNEQNLIKNVNLVIKNYKISALVGSSGSGKSTIIYLLLHYYDVSAGRILVNNIDLRQYDMKTVLKKVGYVSQDTFIYNETIRENISFGGDYTDVQILEAAKKANIHAFIDNLPSGYDSIVGDQGLKLSGGEKQRIAIARALVRDPVLLVLDEATSNLDNESEAIVQDSINNISQSITTFVVAHRLSTIKKANTIYVMSKGSIVEYGSHDELMEKKGRYYELYEAEE
jgi:ABC-type multidrug transport system fused ATPase/permease subunit